MANANDGVVDNVTVRSISLADLEDLKHLHKKKFR